MITVNDCPLNAILGLDSRHSPHRFRDDANCSIHPDSSVSSWLRNPKLWSRQAYSFQLSLDVPLMLLDQNAWCSLDALESKVFPWRSLDALFAFPWCSSDAPWCSPDAPCCSLDVLLVYFLAVPCDLLSKVTTPLKRLHRTAKREPITGQAKNELKNYLGVCSII